MLTRLWTLREPISRAVRDRVVSVLGDFDFVRTLATRGASELAVSYRHSPIVAEDRPGLLYDMTRTLSAAGCNIEVVLIDTEAHKAIDVFYVTSDGHKPDAAQLDRLSDALQRACE